MTAEPPRGVTLRGALVLTVIALVVAFAVGAVVRGASAHQADDRGSGTAPAAQAPAVDLQLSPAITAFALHAPPRRPTPERVAQPRRTPRPVPRPTVRLMPVNVAPTPAPPRATPAPTVAPPPPPAPAPRRVAPRPTPAPPPAPTALPEPSGEFDTTGEQ